MPDDNSSAPVVNTPTPILPAVAVPGAPAADASTGVDAGAGAGVPAPGVEATPVDAGVSAATVPDSPVVAPVLPAVPAADVAGAAEAQAGNTEIPAEVARKIGESHNVLIALSSDPSVDEMAAAIGLSLYLDKLGKRATAIYSGQTPNALQFLKPEETFENSVDTLQDFVIALNKEKADHLRYKLDGDYVKIFITPYKSRIGEEDLEFSYGDYNVDLVLALDVANGVDLDAALREHGRIMHDAVIVNITTGNPGKLGEIEWSDKSASSVSEMIAKLLYSVNSKAKIEKEEATAFLTGIVAATNRFANAGTTSETMRLASKLIDSGANQQLVSKNITPDVENEMFGMMSMGEEAKANSDPTLLDIEHGNEEGVDETKVVDGTVTEKESTLLDDLKAAEASLAAAGAEITPEESSAPLKIDGAVEAGTLPEVADAVKKEADEVASAVAEAKAAVDSGSVSGGIADGGAAASGIDANSAAGGDTGLVESDGILPNSVGVENPSSDFISDRPEKVIQPPSDMEGLGGGGLGSDTNKYGQMLEDALAGADAASAPTMPVGADAIDAGLGAVGAPADLGGNPAAASAPSVTANPEINGVPEINYMPMPGEEVLPPPPTPPIASVDSVPPVVDPSTTGADAAVPAMSLPSVEPIQPAAPAVEPAPASLGAQPAMQDQVYSAPANDPGAFKIPGM